MIMNMLFRFDMDPAEVERDRGAVAAFFRAQPMRFDGTRRSVYLRAWLHDMEQIFQMCHIEGRLQVQLAVRCLDGSARLWWVETGERQVPHRTWTQFYAVIHERFGPFFPHRGLGAPARDPDIYRDMRHTRYQLISQAWHAYPGETMRHYGWRFREEMLPHVPQDLPDPEIEAQTLLRNGVPAHIRCYVPYPSHDRNVIELIDDILQAEMIAQEAGGDAHVQQEPVPATDEAGPSEPHYEVGPLEDDEPQYVVGPLEDGEPEPQYVVGPLEGEEEDPQYEVGPLEEEDPQYEVGPLEEEDPQYEVGPLEEEDDPHYEVGPVEEEPDQVMIEPLMPFQEVADLLAQEDDELMHLEPPQPPPVPLVVLSSDDEGDDGDDPGNEDDEMSDFPEEDEDEEEDPEEFPLEDEEDEQMEFIPGEEEDPEEFPLEDNEDEPMEIVPDAGDGDDDPDSGSDASALTLEVHF